MQASATRDFLVGLFVLAGLGSLAYLSLVVGGDLWGVPGGFRLYAAFDDVGGLKTRSRVAISGVDVGRVAAIDLDPSLRARVTLDLDPALQLPVDTSAAILTSGLLGDQFIALEPGAEEQLLQPGEDIAFTERAFSFERTIGKFVNNAGLSDEE